MQNALSFADYPIYWLYIGSGLFIFSLFLYGIYAWIHRRALSHRKFGDKVMLIFAYMPEEHARAFPHILLGIIFLLGISILFSCLLSHLFMTAPEKYKDQVLSFIGFSFTVLLSFISFWTLWQTKKIEHKTGYRINNLSDLIKKLNEDLAFMLKDYPPTRPAKDHHRVLLITTNPLFGSLSHEDKDFTMQFRELLDNISDHIAYAIGNGFENEELFKFQIICGGKNCVNKFHENFFKKKKDPQKTEFINKKNAEVERFIGQLDANCRTIIKRVSVIPSTQFMIIGDTLYEFTLNITNGSTEIMYADIKEDKKISDYYQNTFEVYHDYLSCEE